MIRILQVRAPEYYSGQYDTRGEKHLYPNHYGAGLLPMRDSSKFPKKASYEG